VVAPGPTLDGGRSGLHPRLPTHVRQPPRLLPLVCRPSRLLPCLAAPRKDKDAEQRGAKKT
jgi:hypothetical protein